MGEYARAGIVPLLIGILQIFKRLGLDTKYIPLLSLGLGIIVSLVLFDSESIRAAIIQGIYFGLSAVGLYSGTKNTVEKIL